MTTNGGKGNDLISLSGDAKDNVILYASGDGNNTIYGFNSTSMLSITGNGINLSDAVIKAHRINITAISLKESITS